jgi:peptidoglycan/xylan/chitin deacetylase (PgdA/CDA1 family)
MDGNKVECTVIMYHYVRNMHETEYPNIKGLLIKKFIGQLNYICRNHTVISLEDYSEFLGGRKKIPSNPCILTFDDGFIDHYLNVFPLLKERKLPACFFPITQPLSEHIVPSVHKAHFLLAKLGIAFFAEQFNATLNKEFPELAKDFFVDNRCKRENKYRWDDALTANLKYNIAAMPLKAKAEILNQIFAKHFENERNFCEKLYMGWHEMREMVEAGMSFGGHSHTHPMLSKLIRKEQLNEIEKSNKILSKGLGIKIKMFSYPYGDFNETTIRILMNCRYVCGVTSDVGVNRGNDINPFLIKRMDTNDLPFN